MEKTTINVSEYYGNAVLYSIMPQSIFNALESAFLQGNEFVDVDKSDFDKMINDYQIKLAQCKR